MATTTAKTITAKTIHVLNMPQAHAPESCAPGGVEKLCTDAAARFGLAADCRQADDESALIDLIHSAHAEQAAGIVINAGSHSHTSMALREVLAASGIPAVEVHVSNRHAHHHFRQQTFTANAAFASLSGFGIEGYRLAISGLAAKIGATAIA